MTDFNQPVLMRVLLIDADRELCRLVEEFLSGYGYLVESAHAAQDGLNRALQGDFHVVILDVMLPGMDGFELLRRLRRESDVPVLMLTARGDDTDRIVGPELGADDYLHKTFSTRELLARLRAVTRRSFMPRRDMSDDVVESPVVVGELRVDSGSRMATMRGEALDLTQHQFVLLLALAKSAGRVMTRSQLLRHVAARGYESFDRSIDVHISNLRRKLGDDHNNPKYIKILRAAGYMMVDPTKGHDP